MNNQQFEARKQDPSFSIALSLIAFGLGSGLVPLYELLGRRNIETYHSAVFYIFVAVTIQALVVIYQAHEEQQRLRDFSRFWVLCLEIGVLLGLMLEFKATVSVIWGLRSISGLACCFIICQRSLHWLKYEYPIMYQRMLFRVMQVQFHWRSKISLWILCAEQHVWLLYWIRKEKSKVRKLLRLYERSIKDREKG